MNVEYEGTKIWVPSTMVVHKGDKVKIKLINNVKSDPNQHGFKIAAFNVEAVVTRGEPQDSGVHRRQGRHLPDHLPAAPGARRRRSWSCRRSRLAERVRRRCRARWSIVRDCRTLPQVRAALV